MQLFRNGHKVLTTWPVRAQFRLPRTWTFAGRHDRLQRGSYKWYVWPGTGRAPRRATASCSAAARSPYADAVPLQNRVTPLSELIADSGRGLVYGNRGCLHDDTGRDPAALQRQDGGSRAGFEFRGWQRHPLLQPGRFTELFFLDEATAFAAGHRPCALCRREDYNAFARDVTGARGADEIDEQLHAERLAAAVESELSALPNGTFVLVDDEPWLVLGAELLRWTPRATPSAARSIPAGRRWSPRGRSSPSWPRGGPRTRCRCSTPQPVSDTGHVRGREPAAMRPGSALTRQT